MAKGYHHHHVLCPGIPSKPECASCTSKRLRINGHHPDKWQTDDTTGESLQRFYVSPPCRDQSSLIQQDVVVAPVGFSGGGQVLNMHMTVHTKIISTGGVNV